MSFVAFSPDGKIVASDGPMSAAAGGQDQLTLWRFPNGKFIRQLPGLPQIISPNWKYYATNHGVRAMDTGTPILSLDDKTYGTYAFSPNGLYVAEAEEAVRTNAQEPLVPTKAPFIHIIELLSGKQVNAFAQHNVFSLAYSPNGKTLASGNWNIIKLWDVKTGNRLAVLRGATDYISSLSFDRSGKYLAAGTNRGDIQLWDVSKRKKIWSNSVEGGGDISIPQFSPDGKFIAFGTYGDGTAWLIDRHTGKIVGQRRVSELGCGSTAFSPDGRYLITPSTGGLFGHRYEQAGRVKVFKID